MHQARSQPSLHASMYVSMIMSAGGVYLQLPPQRHHLRGCGSLLDLRVQRQRRPPHQQHWRSVRQPQGPLCGQSLTYPERPVTSKHISLCGSCTVLVFSTMLAVLQLRMVLAPLSCAEAPSVQQSGYAQAAVMNAL